MIAPMPIDPDLSLPSHKQRPSKLLMLLEGRAVYDFAGMMPVLAMQRFLPKGDGHPVLVLPGFLASSTSTKPLRKYIADLGYRAHRWKLGYNTGYSQSLHDGMRQRLVSLNRRYGEKVSLVGWSLGGVFARELAREMPELVRQVVTLGSPFRGQPSSSNIHQLFDLISTVSYADLPEHFMRDMLEPPPVPTTAMYSRGDGMVAWQSTVEVSPRTDVENIHVGGAHVGLGFNPRVLIALADRLKQPEGDWQPFVPAAWMRPFFKNWYPDWLVKGHLDPLRETP